MQSKTILIKTNKTFKLLKINQLYTFRHMKPVYTLIIIFLLFSCHGNSQNQINNFDVTRDFKYNPDTILYVAEMSNYLDTTYLNRYEDEILKYEKIDYANGINKNEILFLGSSSFRKWYSLDKDMFPLHVLNRGFGGSTLPEAIYFFNRIAIPYQPTAIVLYEGDNDITAPFLTAEVTLKMFKLFVRLTEKYLPDTKVFFLSIKPSPARLRYKSKLLNTNKLIKNECKKKSNLFYIDITKEMYDKNGEVRKDIFQKDKLHMNKKGYEIWSNIIKEFLLENL